MRQYRQGRIAFFTRSKVFILMKMSLLPILNRRCSFLQERCTGKKPRSVSGLHIFPLRNHRLRWMSAAQSAGARVVTSANTQVGWRFLDAEWFIRLSLRHVISTAENIPDSPSEWELKDRPCSSTR